MRVSESEFCGENYVMCWRSVRARPQKRIRVEGVVYGMAHKSYWYQGIPRAQYISSSYRYGSRYYRSIPTARVQTDKKEVRQKAGSSSLTWQKSESRFSTKL
jgi:hypothetical protein